MQIKKIISIVMAGVLIGSPFTISAKILDTDLSKLFMSNVTGSGTFTNQQRTGVIGGSISLRTPISAVNLVAFDAPRFNAGCGGIDLSLGSFSFISADQLPPFLDRSVRVQHHCFSKQWLKGRLRN